MLAGVHHQRQVVVHCCEIASMAGVRIGMDIAHARALVPGDQLDVYDDDPARDAAALEVLARWANRVSPRVALDPPDGLVIDLAGCDRIHPDPARLIGQLHLRLARQGIAARIAIAPTVGCAWALARFASPAQTASSMIITDPAAMRDALALLPVRALRISPATEAALREVAIDQVGHLYALSRGQMAQRFGDELLWRLDLALGQAFEPIDAVAHVEPTRVWMTFDGPVKDLEAITLATRQLVDELAAELAQREAGVTRLRFGLVRVDAPPAYERVELSAPTRDVRHLWTLLRPIVEKAPLGFGVDEVELWASEVSAVTHAQASCWSGDDALSAKATQLAVGRLVDRLSQRFGAQRVSRVMAKQSHVPEQAFEWVPARDMAGKGEARELREAELPARKHRKVTRTYARGRRRVHGEGSAAAAVQRGPVELEAVEELSMDVGGDRPTVLYEKPRAVEVSLMAPDGPVILLSWHGKSHAVVRTVGPQRVRIPWWHKRHGREPTGPMARDYFKLQDDTGHWWWVYRAYPSGRWFVHGAWG